MLQAAAGLIARRPARVSHVAPALAHRSACRFSSGGRSDSIAKLRSKTRIGVHFTRHSDKPGIAADILSVVKKAGMNLTHLESKLFHYSFDGCTVEFDIDGVPGTSPRVAEIVRQIKALGVQANVLPAIPVPWFPCAAKELDLCVEEVIGSDTGGLLAPDHPGFSDRNYMRRREEIAEAANSYRDGDGRLPRIHYTEDEVNTWAAVYERLESCHKKWACDEFLEVLPELKEEAGYGPKQIPQLQDISAYLQGKTGFRLRPVCGLLSARDFLNALAFRTFCSTQYIRHGGNPFYTPEPDICHELIGHVPLLADNTFAEFTQKVGLASLGASDEAICRLANIYWFTVEFGLLKAQVKRDTDDSGIRVMGAGILSSFGEMEWSASNSPSQECRQMGGIARDYPDMKRPKLVDFVPKVAADLPYPITTYQPTYFVGENLTSMKELISDYCDTIERKFYPVYDPMTGVINPSRHVERLPRTSTAHLQAEKQKAYFDNLSQA